MPSIRCCASAGCPETVIPRSPLPLVIVVVLLVLVLEFHTFTSQNVNAALLSAAAELRSTPSFAPGATACAVALPQPPSREQ
jgi:hypothetical protein